MPVRARLSLFAGIASTVLATFGTSCSDRPAQARNKDDAATPKAVMTERVRRQEIQRIVKHGDAVDIAGLLPVRFVPLLDGMPPEA